MRYFYVERLLKATFSKEKSFTLPLGWLASREQANMVRNIFPKIAPSVAVLVPPSSSMAAVLKALTSLTRKSDLIDAEVSDHRQHTTHMHTHMYTHTHAHTRTHTHTHTHTNKHTHRHTHTHTHKHTHT